MTLPPEFQNWRYPHRITYKGYRLWCAKKSERTVKAQYLYRHFNFHLPRSFVWADAHDRAGLVRYIDALILKDALLIKSIEKEGFASEQTYDDPPEGDVKVQQISPQLLLSCLLGEYPIECPSDVTLHIRPIGGKFYQMDMLKAELVQAGVLDTYYENIAQRTGAGLLVRTPENMPVTEGKDGKVLGADHHLNQPGFNLAAAADQGMRPEAPPQPQAAPERTVSVCPINDCCEVVTTNGQFYIRRIMTATGHLLSMAVSNSAEGPWQIQYKDEVGLEAHGVAA